MTSSREQLLRRLRDLVQRCIDEQDPSVVLSDDAMRLASQLWEATEDPRSDLEVLQSLGWLHWMRYLYLPEGSDQQDLHAALELLEPMYRVDPGFVPDKVRQHFDSRRPEATPPSPAASPMDLLRASLASPDPALLNRAVRELEKTLSATPPDDPDRAGMLSNLGIALQVRYERIGAGADLDRAVQVSDQAVSATASDHPNRASRLSTLGNALLTRYQRTGAQADLDRAIQVHGQAVAATHPTTPTEPACCRTSGPRWGSGTSAAVSRPT